MLKLDVSALIVITLACLVQLNAQRRSRTNCRVGSYCDQCPEGEYRVLRVGIRDLKVCCSGCGTYIRAGYRGGDNLPYCQCDDVTSIRGDCWKGHQCDTCLAGPNAGYVGRINTIPICCENCERSGMAIGSRYCRCLHNGP